MSQTVAPYSGAPGSSSHGESEFTDQMLHYPGIRPRNSVCWLLYLPQLAFFKIAEVFPRSPINIF
ncbi:MAG: hypothetical protein KR126chlam1_00066 [Chlamydiae bacterium]|nr:hypothetical protein [Chlamydiota bacterium]